MAYEKKEDDLGGLWIKSGARGEFMTGSINGVGVVCFRNDKKTGNQPDWRVLKAKPREDAAPAKAINAADVPF